MTAAMASATTSPAALAPSTEMPTTRIPKVVTDADTETNRNRSLMARLRLGFGGSTSAGYTRSAPARTNNPRVYTICMISARWPRPAGPIARAESTLTARLPAITVSCPANNCPATTVAVPPASLRRGTC